MAVRGEAAAEAAAEVAEVEAAEAAAAAEVEAEAAAAAAEAAAAAAVDECDTLVAATRASNERGTSEVGVLDASRKAASSSAGHAPGAVGREPGRRAAAAVAARLKSLNDWTGRNGRSDLSVNAPNGLTRHLIHLVAAPHTSATNTSKAVASAATQPEGGP